MDKITSVIFDWGGVLIDDPAPALTQYYAKSLDVSKEEYKKAYNKFSADFQKGFISEELFWIKVCRELDKTQSNNLPLWRDAFRLVYSPRMEVFIHVSKLHDHGYKTALLTNTEIPAMEFFYEQEYDMFDVLVFSCAEGTIKPERKIFEITIQKLGCKPEQLVFIDDNPEFIEGAKKAGLHTILFESAGQIREKLAELGVK